MNANQDNQATESAHTALALQRSQADPNGTSTTSEQAGATDADSAPNAAGTTIVAGAPSAADTPDATTAPQPALALYRLRFKNSAAAGTIGLSGTLQVKSPVPLALADIDFYLGETPIHICLEAPYPLAEKRRAHTCKARISIAFADAQAMPVNNPLIAQFPRPDGATARTNVKYLLHMRKYLALRGPLYSDAESGLVAFFCQTPGKNVQFTVRQRNATDSLAKQVKLYAAWALAKIAPVPSKAPGPVLLYEKNCQHYEESARVVFERLVDDGNRSAWFVLNHDALEKLDIPDKYRKRIVTQHSFAHYLRFFRCTTFIGSEAMGHALELRCLNAAVMRKLKSPGNRFAFLQHGVMYMVSLDSPERTGFRKSAFRGPTKIVVSSQLEANHFMRYAGFAREDLVVCGLPKFDRSYQNPDADKILVMLTWRPWEFALARKQPEATGYARMVHRIVDAMPPELKDKVVVAPHPLFNSETFGHVALAATGSYDELLRDTCLLVTDYSSIAYDAFHRGANVVFYWEEKDACMARYGEPTHLMIDERTAFGPTCRTPGELTRQVEALFGQPQSQEYVKRYSRIVEFHDGKNTDRLVASLKEAGFLG